MKLVVDESVVVFLDAFLQLSDQVGALDPIHEVVVQQAVLLEVEDANGVFTVGLNEVLPVAVLVGQVDIGNERGIGEGVEHVASKGEHRVVYAEGRKDGDIHVDLLGNLIDTLRLQPRGHIKGEGDGIHAQIGRAHV